MRLVSPICLAVALALSAGCATTPTASPTALQVQAYQTKEFETDKSPAFGAVISVFQDLGYIVQSADKDTGFITAYSPSKNTTNIFLALGGSQSSGQTKATAFLEQIRPGFTSVRLNFVNSNKVSSAYGQSSDTDKPIMDPAVYQNAFNKIEDAIFVRTGTRGAPSSN